MKIRIDHARCTGHGRCYSLASGVFGSDDEGFSVLERAENIDDPDLAAQARFGATSCPEGAISLDEA